MHQYGTRPAKGHRQPRVHGRGHGPRAVPVARAVAPGAGVQRHALLQTRTRWRRRALAIAPLLVAIAVSLLVSG